jgi:hypothetical protein
MAMERVIEGLKSEAARAPAVYPMQEKLKEPAAPTKKLSPRRRSA